VGIGKDRLRLEWIAASEAPKMAETVKSFTQTIRELGPNPIVRKVSQDSARKQAATVS
jgi:coenzyme F420-reducing hydrogenase delta subunit